MNTVTCDVDSMSINYKVMSKAACYFTDMEPLSHTVGTMGEFPIYNLWMRQEKSVRFFDRDHAWRHRRWACAYSLSYKPSELKVSQNPIIQGSH